MKPSMLISVGLIAVALGLSNGCADSSFTGSAPQKKADTAKKAKGGVGGGDDVSLDANGGKLGGVVAGDDTDLGNGTGTSTPAEVVIETIEGCGGGSKVADPEATFTFANADEMRTLVNSQGKYTMIPIEKWNAGAVHYDQASADAVCKIKGYLASVSMTRGRYSSCGDNNLGNWDELQKNFIIYGACKDNSRLDGNVCKGKMKDICTTDLSWMYKKP